MSFLAGMTLGGIIGFFIGVILTCILLCKRSLKVYSKIGDKIGQTKDSALNNIKVARNVYKQAIDEYENGIPAPSYEEEEEETENAVEE